MAGFGAAAWSLEGRLVATTYEGDIQHWEDETQAWRVVGQLDEARFFHRLLPLNDHELVAVGGANMESGKFVDLKRIEVRQPTR